MIIDNIMDIRPPARLIPFLHSRSNRQCLRIIGYDKKRILIFEIILRVDFQRTVRNVQRRIQTERCTTHVKMALDIGDSYPYCMYTIASSKKIPSYVPLNKNYFLALLSGSEKVEVFHCVASHESRVISTQRRLSKNPGKIVVLR